jgi:hypothetical protein
MQRRSFSAAGLVMVGLVAFGYASTSSAQLDPFAMLSQTLGMSKDQVEGGIGSVLTLAQEKLAKGDFDKIAAAIPGASKYLDQAKKLGAVTGPLNNSAGLTSALGKLGIDQKTAQKFLPAVTELVSKTGGADAGKLLSGVLGS